MCEVETQHLLHEEAHMQKQKLRLDSRNLDMTLQDAILILTDGNPSAIVWLTAIMTCDPDGSDFFTLQNLDQAHIYGHRIGLLCRACNHEPMKFRKILRAWRCDVAGVNADSLQYAMDHPEEPGIDWDAVDSGVGNGLPY